MPKGLTSLFERLLPQSGIQQGNTYFATELKKLHGQNTEAALIGYTLKAFLTAATISVVVSLFELLTAPVAGSDLPQYVTLTALETAAWLFVLLSVLMMLITEFTSIRVSAGLINRDKANGQWKNALDTVHDENELVAAKFAVGQVRVWRAAAREMAVRFGLVIAILLSQIYYRTVVLSAANANACVSFSA